MTLVQTPIGSRPDDWTLVGTGAAVMVLATMVWALAFMMSLPVSSRPRRTPAWARRKAESRVAPTAEALATLRPPFPGDAVVRFDARRRQMERRTYLLLMPVFAVDAIGLLVGGAGALYPLAPWRDTVGDGHQLRQLLLLLGLMFEFLLVFLLIVWRQKWIYNQVPDLFAAHSLLRATELCLELHDPAVDPVGIRREINGQLGGAAGYLRRYFGWVLPLGVRRRDRREVVRHAERLAAAIRRLQLVATRTSRSDLVAMAPDLAKLLSALVEDRLGDLPTMEQQRSAAAGSDRIFLCYSRRDMRRVKNVRQDLIRDGHHVWMDIHDVPGGAEWQPLVLEALRLSARVLVFLTEEAVSSRGFYQREVRAVLDAAREFPDGARYVVPVRLGPCELPRGLAPYQAIDLYESDGYDRLLKTLDDDGAG